MKLNVPDMSCGHCKAAIEDAISALDTNAVTNVDLAKKTVEVKSEETISDVVAALDAAGFPSEIAAN